jgi:3-hydroxyanthranilate 3,4-dioxygenase
MPQLPASLKLNLNKWIKDNAKDLKPPVSNKQLFKGVSDDVILFVSGGPNTRNDFHVNPTEELFYQLKGDVAVRVRPLDGTKPYDVIIKEGELFLLPRWVPHRPQRPAGTVGLIAEFPRGFDAQGNPQQDGLQWYCPKCDTLVYFPRFVLKEIDKDLAVVMNDFWDGPVERRTCKSCGHIIQRAETIAVKGGKVKPAGAYKGNASSNGKAKRTPGKKKAQKSSAKR